VEFRRRPEDWSFGAISAKENCYSFKTVIAQNRETPDVAAKKEKKAAMLPKVIAGVKIPKVVREHLAALAKNPMVADLLAAGLVSLAAKLKGEPAPQAAAAPAPAKKPAAPKAGTKAAAAKAPAKTPSKKAPAKPAAPKTPAPKAATKPAATKVPAKRPPARRKPVTT